MGSGQGAFEQLAPESQARLQRRLTCEQSMRLPFTRSSLKACELLSFALATPEQASHQNDEEPEADDEQGESDEDDMPPLVPDGGWESHLGVADEAGVPQKAVCQLSGALMHDPVSTPDGYLFERAAIEDWMSQHGSNPLTGAPLAMDDVMDRQDIANFIQGFQMQMLSVSQVAPEVVDRPKEEDRDVHLSGSQLACENGMEIPGVQTGPSLLGVGNLETCIAVCPITQKALRMDECQGDPEMKKRIVKFLKGHHV
ncbi:U-box domain-containing protein 35 (Plant U-box protein 35) [Includes: E3 ubiquitin ligase (RING-type E3 ubiquitin transferase) [Durusdinium trenchii]|uniref:U-box domain-containing protein 35 (Plant U-box protein 35) n=1 Tax=Durusdinium trenchii TaxID=1381693 RepID=A0ABP0HP72_9DINO